MEPGFDQKTWLDYVVKLNDREVRRKSSNGLTLWALIGVIGVLSFKIIDEFSAIFENSKSLAITVIFIAIILNICIALFSINVSITSNDRKRGIITDIAGKSLTIYIYTISLLVILLIVFNYYAAIFSHQEHISQWPYYVLSIIYFINLLGLVIMQVVFFRRKIKLKVEPYSGARAGRISSLCQCFLLLAMTIISIREVQTLVFLNQGLLKVALEFTTIIFCLVLLGFKYGTSLKNNWLEVFEKEIIINDLSAGQIRTKFIEEFLGKQTLDWLRGVQNEIDKKNDTIQNMFQELTNNFLDFNDETLEHTETMEIVNFNTDFLEKIVYEQSDYCKYIELRAEEIKSFSTQGLLSKEEKDSIELIKNQWYMTNSINEKILTEIKSKLDDQKLRLKLSLEKLLQEKEFLLQEQASLLQEQACLEDKDSEAEVS